MREGAERVLPCGDFAEMTKERMEAAHYPREPKGDYFIFRFDEEVSIGDIDLHRLISRVRIEQGAEFVEGAPIYLKGEEVIKFRK